jgi:hypothetical protein
MSVEYPGRWICNKPDCEEPVEANPKLYLSLSEDGTWCITGVEDDGCVVQCANHGHDQKSLALSKSLTAFLEETFPGCTWQTSGPQWRNK